MPSHAHEQPEALRTAASNIRQQWTLVKIETAPLGSIRKQLIQVNIPGDLL